MAQWTQWLQQRVDAEQVEDAEIAVEDEGKESVYDGEHKLSHFLQITKVTDGEFIARLDVWDIHKKRRRYPIKDMLNPEEDMDEITIRRKTTFGENSIDFDEEHTDNNYQIAVFENEDDDIECQLSNIIGLHKYALDPYPPAPNSEYKPNPIDPVTIHKILDKNNEKVYIYWHIPQGTFGDIGYKVMIDNATSDEMVTLLPYTIPLSLIPTSIQIITVSTFSNDKQYVSAPVRVHIGPKPIKAKPIDDEEEKSEIQWDEQPSYFMHITSISEEDFTVRLVSDSMDDKNRRRLKLKEMDTDDGIDENITIRRNMSSVQTEIDIEEDHGNVYRLAVYDKKNTENPLQNSNQIQLELLDKKEYPPLNKAYKPNPIDSSSVLKVKDEANKTMHLYWSTPSKSIGTIKYRIVKDNQAYDDEKDLIIDTLPHTMPLQIPTLFTVVTMATLNDIVYESDPSTPIVIGTIKQSAITATMHESLPIKTTEIKPQVEEKQTQMKWDAKPSYFMQIITVNDEEFTLQLISDSMDNKNKRRFKIKEVGDNDGIDEDINIKRKKSSVQTKIDIEEDHGNVYHLAVYDKKNTQHPLKNSNQIQLELLNKNEYPPSNKKYKPNPIDLSTVLKVKDEEKDELHMYWSIPPKSFGDIKYRIMKEDKDDDEKDTIIDSLPYSIALTHIVSFRVITLTTIHKMSYESNPSQPITLGTAPKSVKMPQITAPIIKPWKERAFPNFLQILGVDHDTIKIKLAMEESSIAKRKCRIRNVADNDAGIGIKLGVPKNTMEVIKNDVDVDPKSMYCFAIFLDEKQTSNAVRVQTPPEQFEPKQPLPPLKETVHTFYDENKENLLIVWDYPQGTVGDEIKYKIQLSNKADAQEINDLPYKLAITAPSIKFKIRTVAIRDGKAYESKPSESITVDVPPSLVSKSKKQRTISAFSGTALTLPIEIEYLNETQPIHQLSVDRIKDATFEQFKQMILKKCNIDCNQQTLNALRIVAMIDGDSHRINQANFKPFVVNDVSKPGIILNIYLHPLPPTLITCKIDANTAICNYKSIAPFKLQYEIKSKSNEAYTIKNETDTQTNTLRIDNISSFAPSFTIRARCLFSNIFTCESDWCSWSTDIQVPKSMDKPPQSVSQNVSNDDGVSSTAKNIRVRFVNRSDDNMRDIYFALNEAYDTFVDMCFAEFNLVQSGIDRNQLLMVGDTNDKNDHRRYTSIKRTGFNDYLKNKYQSNCIINIGISPSKPDIQIIQRRHNSVEICTSQMQHDGGHYQYQYKLYADTSNFIKDGDARKGHNNVLRIDALPQSNTYYIQIRILNGVTESQWSDLKRIAGNTSQPPVHVDDNKHNNDVADTGVHHPVIVHPNDQALAYDGQQRDIWYLTNDVLDDNCNYFCTMHGDEKERFPFKNTYSGKDCGIYYAIIPKQTTQLVHGYYYICLKIFKKEKNKKPEEFPFKWFQRGKAKGGGNNKYMPNGFYLEASKRVHILDITTNTWNARWLTDDTFFSLTNKHVFYQQIGSHFFKTLLDETNTTIPPYICVLAIEEFWNLITKDCKYPRNHSVRGKIEQYITTVCENNSTQHALQNIKTWRTASQLLATIGAIMLINSKNEIKNRMSYTISDDLWELIYAHITDVSVFGDINFIIENIAIVYFDHISELQTEFWLLQSKMFRMKRLRYLLWYNLLCCARSDPVAKYRATLLFLQYPKKREYNKISVLDSRLDASATKRPHPFLQQRTNMIMKDSDSTYKQVLEIINDIGNIGEVHQFMLGHKRAIENILGDDTSAWLSFIGALMDRVSATPSSKLLSVIIKTFTPQIKSIAHKGQKDIKRLYAFYQKYGKMFQGSAVEEQLVFYEEIVKDTDFIPILVHLLRPKKSTYTQTINKSALWWVYLKDCTQIWLNEYQLSQTIEILRDHQLNTQIVTHIFENNDHYKMDNYVPHKFESKLQMLQSNEYDESIIILIVNTINESFEDLNVQQNALFIETTEILLQKQPGIADTLLRTLIKTNLNPFVENQSDKDIIKYVTSRKGKVFIHLLASLNKYKQFEELPIRNRLIWFGRWWRKKVQLVASKAENYGTVDTLSKCNNFNDIQSVYVESNLERIKTKHMNLAQGNLKKYKNMRIWLSSTVGLPQYLSLFIQNGYDSLEFVSKIKHEKQLDDIGITMKGHQTQILYEIEVLRNAKNPNLVKIEHIIEHSSTDSDHQNDDLWEQREGREETDGQTSTVYIAR